MNFDATPLEISLNLVQERESDVNVLGVECAPGMRCRERFVRRWLAVVALEEDNFEFEADFDVQAVVAF